MRTWMAGAAPFRPPKEGACTLTAVAGRAGPATYEPPTMPSESAFRGGDSMKARDSVGERQGAAYFQEEQGFDRRRTEGVDDAIARADEPPRTGFAGWMRLIYQAIHE